tara:strand:+ start:227 stop:391 length:165 start_codon:yes stop_codon:yes gene_type:complete
MDDRDMKFGCSKGISLCDCTKCNPHLYNKSISPEELKINQDKINKSFDKFLKGI